MPGSLVSTPLRMIITLLVGLVHEYRAQTVQHASYCESNERVVVTFESYNACESGQTASYKSAARAWQSAKAGGWCYAAESALQL